MTTSNDLLIEIGTEELPPKALQTLSNAFTEGVVAGFKKAALEAQEVISYAAPRRLAVLLKGIPEKQQDQLTERRDKAVPIYRKRQTSSRVIKKAAPPSASCN